MQFSKHFTDRADCIHLIRLPASVESKVSLRHHVNIVEDKAGEVVQLPGLEEGGVHDGALVEHVLVHLGVKTGFNVQCSVYICSVSTWSTAKIW